MAQCCINPSILSADFVNLEAELHRISNADAVHVDVMDNHFVPNLTIGLPVVQRIQEISPVPLDAHLMIADADRWAPGLRRRRGGIGDLPRGSLDCADQTGPGAPGTRVEGRDGAPSRHRAWSPTWTCSPNWTCC